MYDEMSMALTALALEETDRKQTIQKVIKGASSVESTGNGYGVHLFGQDSLVKEIDETHPAQDAQNFTGRRSRKKKPRNHNDFNWEDDLDFWEESERPKKKKKQKFKVRDKYSFGINEHKNYGIKQQNSQAARDKNSLVWKSSTSDRHQKEIEKSSNGDKQGIRETDSVREGVNTEGWCSDWITDDEVDDDDDDDDDNEDIGTDKHAEESEENRTCSRCMLTFNSSLLLLEHAEGNHAACVCDICGFTTTYKHKLRRHMVKHTKEKCFVCDICGKQYSQNQNLRDHISRVHSDDGNGNRYPFSCQYCKRLYRGERNLIRHQKQDCGPCEVCGVTLNCSGLLWLHKRNHFSECELCKKGFQSRNALLLHKSTKHGEKTNQCSQCPKKFVFLSHLKNHLVNTHNEGAPQYKCKECSFCARSISYLKSHQNRMHKNPHKVYSCAECKKDFRSNARLVEHTRIHTGERPFSCPVCFKTFYSQSNLYAHERSVHGRLTNYGLKDTGIESDTSLVRRKILSCYQCNLCDSAFPTRKKLNYHLFRDHRISAEVKKRENMNPEHLMESNEGEVPSVQIHMKSENFPPEDIKPVTKQDDVINVISSSNESLVTKEALSLPAYVVPPNVNVVEIAGVKYHVIRSGE
ncbi:uncharacterized protein [Panulirus ornatus]|uniref:uncharacterized protein isoform X2 n=1 Tax=Panulirus ornatus TaxID=150431 RepID=UPI003A89F732